MSSNLLEDDSVGLYFIIPEGLTQDECNHHMQEAFQASITHDFTPSWKNESECLDLTPTKRNVFVFQQFAGSAFSYLQKFKCVFLLSSKSGYLWFLSVSSIVGPRCLLSCMASNTRIPLVASPMFTAAMRDLIVSASGGGAKLKDELKQKVEHMAGKYTKRLLENTTHLIVNSVTTNKYERACEIGVSIYTIEWVHAVWLKSQEEDVLATDSQFDKFKCPPFLGLTVCSSNLRSSHYQAVRKCVTDYGGTFVTTFTISVNVLVVRGSSSEKFKAAKQHKIPCVSVDWILESVKKGYALPFHQYEVDGTLTSSPKAGNRDNVKFCDDSNISVIPFGNRTHIDETVMDSTTCSVSSLRPIPAKSATNSTVMDKTANGTATFFPPPAKPFSGTPKKSIKSENHKTPVKNSSLCNPGEFRPLLQHLDVEKAMAAGAFLDGCGVYLHGWNAEEEEKLKRILKRSGAARFAELCDKTSHVLVGEMDKTLPRLLNLLANKPHVVSVKWLIDSVSQKVPASEELYACYSLEQPNEAPSPLSKKGMAILQQGMVSPVKVINSVTEKDMEPKKGLHGSNMILQKYQGADSSYESDLSAICLKPVGNKSDSATAMPPPPAPGCPPKFKEFSTLTSVSDSSKSESQIEEAMVFKGLKFVICDLNEEAAAYVRNDLIEAYGGEIVSPSFKGKPDFAIVPLSVHALNQSASEIVTSLWLEDCIARQETLSVDFYHKPVVVDIRKQPLQSCVLGFSGYTHKSRKFVMELSQILGAVTQEVFARTNKPDGTKASTHLICKSTEPSQKYSAAVKWGIPAVTHEWLLACASSSRQVSEEPFLLNKDVRLPNKSDYENSSHCLKSPRVTGLQTNNDASTPLRHDPETLGQLLKKPHPVNPYDVKTPEMPLGFSKNPSPEKSKSHLRWLNTMDKSKPKEPQDPPKNSPSLSEARRNLLMIAGAQFMKSKELHSIPQTSASDPDCDPSSESCKSKTDISSDDTGPKSLIDGRLDKLKKLIETPEAKGNASPQPAKRTLIQHNPGRTSDTLGPLNSDPLKGASQPYAIMWEDPVNLNKMSKSTREASCERPVSPLKETSSNKKRKSSESCDEVPPEKKVLSKKDEKVFLLSHIPNNKKDSYVRIITMLKGKFLETGSYDRSATHLVLALPSRNEKLLSSLACGIWVLDPSYLDDSCKKGAFLKEELYEWGNPLATHLEKNLRTPLEKALAKACHRWRMSLLKSGEKGAFSGKRFVIKTGETKMAAMVRLVQCGGGVVVNETDAVKGDICCYDKDKVAVDLHSYAKKGVICVPVSFISDLLIYDPPPTPDSRVTPEYESIRQQLMMHP